jgi:hypothetical protein
MKKKYLALFAIIGFCFSFSQAADVQTETASPSRRLIQAARSVIYQGRSETSCSLYVYRIMNQAGYKIGSFTANEFGWHMRNNFPYFKEKAFYAGSEAAGRGALRYFLNSAPNSTAFLAQWIRSGRYGHVALVVKEDTDVFRIYQAQLGRAPAHSKITSIENLLYAPNAYGDRSRLRLFYQY